MSKLKELEWIELLSFSELAKKFKRQDSEFPLERVLTSHHPTGSNTPSKAPLPLA